MAVGADLPDRKDLEHFLTMRSDSNFHGFMQVIESIDRRNPGLLRGLELPGAGGELLPFKEALIEKMLPGKKAALVNWDKYSTLENGTFSDTAFIDLKTPFALFSREPSVGMDMISAIEKSLASPGAPDTIDAQGQRAFVAIGRLTLSDKQTQRLGKTLSKYRYHRFSDKAVNDTMNALRKDDVEKLQKKLASDNLGAGETLDAARQLLALTYCRDIDAITQKAFLMSLGALEKALARGGDRDRKKILDSLMSNVKRSCRRAKNLEATPLLEKADFHMLYHLGKNDPGICRDLKDFINGDLKKNGEPKATLAAFIKDSLKSSGLTIEKFLRDSFRKDQLDDNVARLGSQPMGRNERTGIFGENESLMGQIYYFPTGDYPLLTHSSFRDGLNRSDPEKGLGDMPTCIKNPDRLYGLYCTLAPGAETDEEIAPAWHNFRDILQVVGGEERFDLAVNMYRYVEQQAAAGLDRGKALAHAVKCYTLDCDPRTTPMQDDAMMTPTEVEMLDDDQISIGGIRLNIKG